MKICVVVVKVCKEFRVGPFSARADPTPGHPGRGELSLSSGKFHGGLVPGNSETGGLAGPQAQPAHLSLAWHNACVSHIVFGWSGSEGMRG